MLKNQRKTANMTTTHGFKAYFSKIKHTPKCGQTYLDQARVRILCAGVVVMTALQHGLHARRVRLQQLLHVTLTLRGPACSVHECVIFEYMS